jgi:hypothetical protein
MGGENSLVMKVTEVVTGDEGWVRRFDVRSLVGEKGHGHDIPGMAEGSSRNGRAKVAPNRSGR